MFVAMQGSKLQTGGTGKLYARGRTRGKGLHMTHVVNEAWPLLVAVVNAGVICALWRIPVP